MSETQTKHKTATREEWLKARVALLNCFREHGQSLVGRRIIVARSSPGEVRNLYVAIGNKR